MIDITPAWRPKEITSKTLLKAGYSQAQLDSIGKVFVERYNGQNIANAGSVYSKMVRDSGPGFNNSTKLSEPYKPDLSQKSPDGEKRAQEAKQQDVSDDMKLASAERIRQRYGTPFDECKRIVGLEI